jgi:hypothetical protein
MAMTELDRDFIMLAYAGIECRRALDNLAEVDQLAAWRMEAQSGVELRENLRIFDRIRLSLQMAANVSRLFWPPREKSKARGEHLRALTGLPETHGLSDRKLRNHIEHFDERLDAWTAISPRPFLALELVLHEDDFETEQMRDEVISSTAVIYDAEKQSVHLFGDTFSLPALCANIQDVHDRIGPAKQVIRSSWK